MKRYPDLMDFLSTSEMLGSDQYPTTIVGVYELLLQYNMTKMIKEVPVVDEIIEAAETVQEFLSFNTADHLQIYQSQIFRILFPALMVLRSIDNATSVSNGAT